MYYGCNIPRASICGGRIFYQFVVLSHNFGSRYVRKPIKGFKDWDDGPDSKKTCAKNCSMVGAQGQINWSKSRENIPP